MFLKERYNHFHFYHPNLTYAYLGVNIDYLILGEKPGSKKKKAIEIGVKIISEIPFLIVFNT